MKLWPQHPMPKNIQIKPFPLPSATICTGALSRVGCLILIYKIPEIPSLPLLGTYF